MLRQFVYGVHLPIVGVANVVRVKYAVFVHKRQFFLTHITNAALNEGAAHGLYPPHYASVVVRTVVILFAQVGVCINLQHRKVGILFFVCGYAATTYRVFASQKTYTFMIIEVLAYRLFYCLHHGFGRCRFGNGFGSVNAHLIRLGLGFNIKQFYAVRSVYDGLRTAVGSLLPSACAIVRHGL